MAANTKPFGDPIYKIFEDFIKETLLNEQSSLNNIPHFEKPIFTEENLMSIIEAYVKNYADGKGNFYEKLKNQLDAANVSNEARAVFASLMWLKFLFQGKRIDKQPNSDGEGGRCGEDTIKKIKGCTIDFGVDCYDSNNGCVPYGLRTLDIDTEMTDLVLLYYRLIQKSFDTYDDIKNYIICWCLDIDGNSSDKNKKGIRSEAYSDATLKLPEQRKCPKTLLPLHNMLLYSCNHEHYDNIAVSGDKAKIAKSFESILMDSNRKIDLSSADAIGMIDNADKVNKKIYCIYKKLSGGKGNPMDFNRIYHEPYRSMWRNEGTELDAIKFKKALILYGPPGTSKTYKAKELAKSIICQLNYADKLDTYLNDLDNDKVKNRIHRLQLHPNYTYEDFVWGYQIENEKYDTQGIAFDTGNNLQCVGNKTTPKKGYFLRLLDEIAKDEDNKVTLVKIKEAKAKEQDAKKQKDEACQGEQLEKLEKEIRDLEKQLKIHVLILDEINRVDLSRLFGELFSAIENRDEAIDLPVVIEGLETKKVLGQMVSQICIPKNLYIIGTMNEIDFSLERVDFALRRRFIWKHYGYNPEALYSIIEEKKSKYSNWSKPDDDDLEEYENRCKALNSAIRKDTDLGEQFEIGHTFFGELVDIWATKSSNTKLNTIQGLLWDISIGPMIEAYLGNCDADTKKKKLDDFKYAFIPELKKENGKKDNTDPASPKAETE